MDVEKFRESGQLELFVAGLLSEQENEEVMNALASYPELQAEVEAIESSIISLSEAAAPKDSIPYSEIQNRRHTSVMAPAVRKLNWWTYTGWAAAFLLGAGLLYTTNQNSSLEEQLTDIQTKNQFLEETIQEARMDRQKTRELLDIIRDRTIDKIELAGQPAAPESYAQVYWDKQQGLAYIDAVGLPAPPEGMGYQVWSLKLSPLSPTSLGMLKDFAGDENKIFTLENLNESEAFGITLEPKEGSEVPTLEQLYVLGTVASGP